MQQVQQVQQVQRVQRVRQVGKEVAVFRRRGVLVTCSAALALAGILVAEQQKAVGSITIDGVTTTLDYAVSTTRQNAFDESAQDPVIVLSNQPLSAKEASNEAELFARAERGELVAVAVRFDGRPNRGRLFNVTISHRGAPEVVRLPDVWFQYTLTPAGGTIKLDTREFSGRTYAASAEFMVPVATTRQTVDKARTTGPPLPSPSKTAADRKAATALLIEALQEGDERRSLEIIKLGIDPNGRDEKMGIPVINWAVLMCQPPVVEALVHLKADVRHERLPGMTLLTEATAACPDAVPYLKAAK